MQKYVPNIEFVYAIHKAQPNKFGVRVLIKSGVDKNHSDVSQRSLAVV